MLTNFANDSLNWLVGKKSSSPTNNSCELPPVGLSQKPHHSYHFLPGDILKRQQRSRCHSGHPGLWRSHFHLPPLLLRPGGAISGALEQSERIHLAWWGWRTLSPDTDPGALGYLAARDIPRSLHPMCVGDAMFTQDKRVTPWTPFPGSSDLAILTPSLPEFCSPAYFQILRAPVNLGARVIC